MWIISVFLLCFSVLFVISDGTISYKRHSVLAITPASLEHLEFLHTLRKTYEIDLWNEPSYQRVSILTHVRPELLRPMYDALKKNKIPFKTVHRNLQRLIDHEKTVHLPTKYNYVEGMDFGKYNTYDEILKLMRNLTKRYPDTVKLETIGKSYENRSIFSLKISSGNSLNKSSIIIECGAHAREWSSVAVCAYLANKLIVNYGFDKEITNLLNKYELNIVLVSNPDGYIYTWTKDRMWRKTRSHSKSDLLGVCRGADMNRNFDFEHCGIGTSVNPCSNTFCGDEPFSESEARAIRNLLNSRAGRTKAYFSVHAYSQLWMTPYGTNPDLPPNYASLESVANAGIKALSKRYGTKYKFGTIMRTLYPVSGGSIDYAYTEHNVTFAYAIEVRDEGYYGFFLPKKYILPMCKETYDGIVAAVNAM